MRGGKLAPQSPRQTPHSLQNHRKNNQRRLPHSAQRNRRHKHSLPTTTARAEANVVHQFMGNTILCQTVKLLQTMRLLRSRLDGRRVFINLPRSFQMEQTRDRSRLPRWKRNSQRRLHRHPNPRDKNRRRRLAGKTRHSPALLRHRQSDRRYASSLRPKCESKNGKEHRKRKTKMGPQQDISAVSQIFRLGDLKK